VVVKHSIEINKPFDEVWAVFDDPELQPKWLGMMKSIEQVKGKGNAKGAVQKVVFTRDSGDAELTVTVLEYKEGHLKTRYEGLQLPFELTSDFTAIDDDTTEWAAEIDVQLGLLTRALGPVLKGSLGGFAEDMGDDFKKYVESR
jgi:uncharacterized protein YndB with AHSA1/START domain